MGAPLGPGIERVPDTGERIADALERIADTLTELSNGQDTTNQYLRDLVESGGVSTLEIDLNGMGTQAHPFVIESR